jgi:drug/metabolite transporter (DMT)-like permease
MRSDEEFATEALRRAALLETRTRRKRERLTAGAALAVCLSFVGLIAVVSEGYLGDPLQVVAAAQTPLLFPSVGGYVLCGVVCFAVGVLVTLIFQRKQKPDKEHSDRYKSDENQVQ